MRFAFAATVLAAFASSVIASNCIPGLYYCGKSLIAVGKYHAQIDLAVFDAGKQLISNGLGDLFYCAGGNSGIIQWKAYCGNGCFDAGRDRSDYCS
ncbi:hypothetical protein V495_02804 [Pseudogymnoascus sp. VKM F-4514 (FW-929)]|nr:hypothetical protein V490_07180 [Pseudogymnoascus sp. VKM F-3557]KFY45818.1 hypothetical protein V495_02804 [Pseudogymnoascus sp. VKM F-4514 (FW-929)]KFY51211.1 hypothetical protein V497_09324 [Pseudogymnoascus sp. VKM F-4516 (FW-969)]